MKTSARLWGLVTALVLLAGLNGCAPPEKKFDPDEAQRQKKQLQEHLQKEQRDK